MGTQAHRCYVAAPPLLLQLAQLAQVGGKRGELLAEADVLGLQRQLSAQELLPKLTRTKKVTGSQTQNVGKKGRVLPERKFGRGEGRGLCLQH